MRSIADQSEAELGGRGSLLMRQRRDHAELEQRLQQVAGTTGPEQDAALLGLYRLVFPHAFAEESVIWPVVRRELPDGEELTLRNEQEHQEINELATRLERTRPGDPQRAELFERVAGLLRQDARDEEDLILPRLQAVLDAAELQRLGRAFELVRRTAPTRPHPVVARRPPGNVAAALPLTVVDRTRDRLDRVGRRAGGHPHRVTQGVALAARGASRGLAGVAGAIEHVPPLPWGERPSTHSGRLRREGRP